MSSPIGPEQLGELARWQIEQGRHDPRMERVGAVTVGDFRAAVEEADRVRLLGIWGLHELSQAVSHERLRLGLEADQADCEPEHVSALQAAWERAQMAQAEIDNEYPHLNATALVSLYSALDALVEYLLVGARDFFVNAYREHLIRTLEDHPLPHLDAATRAKLVETAEDMVTEMLGLKDATRLTLKSSGATRYEEGLREVGLSAPPDRPIPPDLDEALQEVGALRDVWTHRAGRVDVRALRQAPSLQDRYQKGQFIRFSRDDYRTYSAALACYGEEVIGRLMHPPENRVVLADWRSYCALNA